MGKAGRPEAGRRRGARVAAILLLVAACDHAPQVETVPLVLRELTGCELNRPQAIELRALGDFPSRSLSSSAERPVFDDLPIATRELEVRALADGQVARGRRILAQPSAAESIWLLPAGRSCLHGDHYTRALDGSALAPLVDGGLFVAGGRDEDGLFSSQASVLSPGAALATAVPEGMLLRRAWASATALDSFVVIAGGTGSARGDAHETYEVFDSASASFVGARSGKLSSARMQHAALLLPDRRLLFVGGRAAPDGAPLASADLLDFDAGKAGAIKELASLSEARVEPIVLGMDTGSVLVLGGRDAAGALVGRVERFDPSQLRFEALPIVLPNAAELVAAALPGGRAAWVGCGAAAVGCELGLLLEQSGEVVSETLALDFDVLAPAGLRQLRIVALDSGRLLLTGADPSDSNVPRRAFLIDLDLPALSLAEASGVPSALVALRTGVIAELDALGLSLRDQDSASAYDTPSGNLIAPELAWIALDAPDHWRFDAADLVAIVRGAQLDIPKLRFDALRLELDCSGDVNLSFTNEAGETAGGELVDGMLLATACSQPRPENQSLVIRVSGDRLELSGSSAGKLCETARPPGPLRVSLRAAGGARIRRLALERL